MPTTMIPNSLGSLGINTGRLAPQEFGLSGRPESAGLFRLPNDPLGTFTMRLTNLVVGSRVRVEDLSGGTELDSFVATAAEHDRTLQRYTSGNPLNNLRIKVRKASEAPAYRPFETQAVAQAGTVSVYVFQEPDE